MRVLLVIPILVVGGAERMVARLAGLLHRWGHTVAVASLFDPVGSWVEAELQEEGIPLRFLAKRLGPDPRVVPRLTRVLREFEPDVVHTHMYVLKYALAALALAGRRRPVIHTFHTLARQEAEPLGRIVQWCAFRSGVVAVAVGEAVAASVRAVYGVSPGAVILNGIPLSRCAAPPGARDEVRAGLGIPREAPTFVCVAQFVPAKEHGQLLAAFASERLRALGAHLLLAGDGARRGALEAQAQAAGVGGRVHFLGERTDVAHVLAAADAFVLASSREGTPLAVMEAMASGLPVLATAIGGVPELATEGTGHLVAPGRPDLLGRAMAELADDLPAARAMGATAARVAQERFSDEAMARGYERLYRGLT
jgi:glycosyltransferase involved in cell wall biosynthesis